MIRTILITGGTGLIGRQLVAALVEKSYTIHLLIRGEAKLESPKIKNFKWDIHSREIDPLCIQDVDAIIHLAGENVGEKRWIEERKREIVESRTESIRMIYGLMRKNKHKIEHVISASGVGYYGDRRDEVLREESLPSKDFLAETCIEWEDAVDEGEKLGLRIVKLRTGIVLDKQGGALPQMARAIQFGAGAIPGKGTQWVSWIHIHDVINIYIWALENQQVRGIYNMAAPEPARLETLMRSIAKASGRKALFFKVPAFAIKIAAGEMSEMALSSTRVTADKLQKSGYSFEYESLLPALENLYVRE